MTVEEFRDAMSKGLGRTTLALQTEDSKIFSEVILQACLENLQWDRQLETGRAPYITKLIDLAGIRPQALDVILKTLPDAEEGWDRDWMIDLLGEFAGMRELRATQALLKFAEQGSERAQDRLAFASEEGLVWVAENVLPGLSDDQQGRIFMWLPDEEADDVTPLQQSLRARYEAAMAPQAKARPAKRRKPAMAAKKFLASLDDKDLPYASPFDFAKTATHKQLRQAADRFLEETEARPLRRLAHVFRKRNFPRPLRLLFAQATHEKRGGAVCRVLGEIDAPQVRHFARVLLRKRPIPWNAVEVITASFRPGDEAFLAAILPEVATYDAEGRHNVVLDLVGLLREHSNGSWQPHADWIYEHSPCSTCRDSAIDWMAKHGTISESIRNEAIYDAEPDIREAVKS